MYLLVVGVVLALLKALEIDPVVAWPWWGVLLPFALAVAWWAWADSTGYTRRKAMEKMEKKRQERIDKQRDALGIKRRR